MESLGTLGKLKGVNGLPSELLIKIFGHLSFLDLQNVRLVCTRWLAIANLSQFHHKSRLCLSSLNCADILEAQKVAPLSLKHRIRNLRVENVDSSPELGAMFSQLGAYVQTLSLNRAPIFESMQQQLENLHELRLCNIASFPKGANLTAMNLNNFRNLRSLYLDSNLSRQLKVRLLQQLTTQGSQLKMEKLKSEFTIDEQELILHVLETHASSLREVSLVYFSSQALHLGLWKRLFQQLGQLRSLQLTGNFKKELLAAIFMHLPVETPLRHLDLTGSIEMDDGILACIAEKWPKSLEKLELMFCIKITDTGVAKLSAVQGNLKLLNLSHCVAITSRGLLEGIACNRNTQLRELYASDLSGLDEECVCVLATRLPNLVHLSLGSCSNAITDRALGCIFRHQTKLQTLDLDHCYRISDEGLLGHGTVEGYPIQRLRSLRSLSLRGCRNLSNLALMRALKFADLRTLKLGYCHKISADGIEALVRNCQTLDTLIVSSCLMLDDEAIGHIAKNLKRLRTLNVSNCVNLTERSIEYIVEFCESLLELSICGIDSLEICGIRERLINTRPQLKEIHV